MRVLVLVFGPIAGALYGPVAFIWIVVGCIFAGAVHDYLTGMISIRNKGAHLPELAAKFLGKFMKHVVNIFALIIINFSRYSISFLHQLC